MTAGEEMTHVYSWALHGILKTKRVQHEHRIVEVKLGYHFGVGGSIYKKT